MLLLLLLLSPLQALSWLSVGVTLRRRARTPPCKPFTRCCTTPLRISRLWLLVAGMAPQFDELTELSVQVRL
jgi:hypothetical protein